MELDDPNYDDYYFWHTKRFIMYGQRLIDAVGLDAVIDPSLIGLQAVYLVKQLKEDDATRHKLKKDRKAIIAFSKEIAQLSDKLTDKITQFDELYDSPFRFVADDIELSHKQMIKILTSLSNRFRLDVPLSIDDDIMATSSNVVFVGRTLAAIFEYIFGIRPGHTSNDLTNTYDGPFIRFVRFIYNEAGINYSAASIARARGLARNQQAYDRWLKETGLDKELDDDWGERDT